MGVVTAAWTPGVRWGAAAESGPAFGEPLPAAGRRRSCISERSRQIDVVGVIHTQAPCLHRLAFKGDGLLEPKDGRCDY